MPYGNPYANLRGQELNSKWTPTCYVDGGYSLYIGVAEIASNIVSRIQSSGSREVAPLDLIVRMDHIESDLFHIEVRIGNNTPANSAPTNPEVTEGPHTVAADEEVLFGSATLDADGDDLYYRWDWGDGGALSDWMGPYASGATCTAGHSWSDGDHDVKVQAKDEWGVETAWSPAFAVHVGCCQVRGNIDNDPEGAVDISDLIYLIGYMFTDGPAPVCMESANIDGDAEGAVDISDLIYLIGYMFTDGPPPVSCTP